MINMINLIKFYFLMLTFVIFSSELYAQQKAYYTLKDLGIIEEDIVFYGTKIDYDFYIPNQPHLIMINLRFKLKIIETLREDHQIELYLNDIPIQVLKKLNSSEFEIPITIKKQEDKDIYKISIKGHLRIHNNICEDAIYNKPVAILQKESTVEFVYNLPKDIRTFLIDYNINYCINNFNLLPVIYHIGKENFYKLNFYWGDYKGCKYINFGDENRIEEDRLYFDTNGIKSIQNGYIRNLFGKDIKINFTKKEDYYRQRELHLSNMGFKTKTIKGVANLAINIPIDLTYLQGKPDKLFMYLIFSTNHPKDRDRLEIRVFINENLIHIISIEKGGINNVTFEIPSNLLSYGYNNLRINLVNFLSSDECQGAFNESLLTVFDHSYIYWNSITNRLETISSFFEGISGDVLLIIEEDRYIPLAIKLLSDLSFYKRNIENIYISREIKRGKFDFIIHFKASSTKNQNFEIYNPFTQLVLFSAKYSSPFLYIQLEENENKLNISNYGDIETEKILDKLRLRELFKFHGNLGIITQDYSLTFEVGKKNRIRYEFEKNLSYYWNRYKLLFVLFMGAIVVAFLTYVYTKLTKRPV